MENKNNIRTSIHHEFLKYTIEDLTHKSFRVHSKIMAHPKVLEAQTVFIYVGKQFEISSIELIDMLLGLGKNVLIPKIFGAEMKAVQVFDTKKFAKQGFGILEPIQTKAYEGKIDCSVIPGIAFGNDGSRIGSGKGYYDKWLVENPDTYKIGLCYDFQILAEIPQDTWDIKMDEIISA